MEPTHIDLFSGIGGFALAAKWVGFETKVFCEIDPFCQMVLKKHWPNVPIVEDIKKFDGKEWTGATLITGGFPCQDISIANANPKGLRGKRSGLWKEFFRVISLVRPHFVIVENVSAFTIRGLLDVLGDIASIGYDAEWETIPASIFGFPHQRKRIFIIAYSENYRHKNSINAESPIFLKWNRFNQEIPIKGSSFGDKESVYEKIRSTEFVRVANGIPNRVDRIKGLGNAIVPQVAYEIIKAIKEAENGRSS